MFGHILLGDIWLDTRSLVCGTDHERDRKQEQLDWDVRYIRPDVDGVTWTDEILTAIKSGREPNREDGGVRQTIDEETRNYFLRRGKSKRCRMVAGGQSLN